MTGSEIRPASEFDPKIGSTIINPLGDGYLCPELDEPDKARLQFRSGDWIFVEKISRGEALNLTGGNAPATGHAVVFATEALHVDAVHNADGKDWFVLRFSRHKLLHQVDGLHLHEDLGQKRPQMRRRIGSLSSSAVWQPRG